MKFKVELSVFKEMTEKEANEMLSILCSVAENYYPDAGVYGFTEKIKSDDKFGQSFFQEKRNEEDVEKIIQGSKLLFNCEEEI